jgi:hypothetical protein
MKHFISLSTIAVLGLFLSVTANATVITCTDTAGNTGSGGKNASSSIEYWTGNVSASNCGPFVGNDSNDLTAALGGYGYDLSANSGADGGWVELDKLDVLTHIEIINDKPVEVFDGVQGGGIITGTGWGGTSGTFTFGANAGYSNYLIALKFDGVYATYLSNVGATNWGWNTDVDSDGGFALSHLSVYARYPTTVPEPDSIALIGLGLIGMGASARRRRKL